MAVCTPFHPREDGAPLDHRKRKVSPAFTEELFGAFLLSLKLDRLDGGRCDSTNREAE